MVSKHEQLSGEANNISRVQTINRRISLDGAIKQFTIRFKWSTRSQEPEGATNAHSKDYGLL